MFGRSTERQVFAKPLLVVMGLRVRGDDACGVARVTVMAMTKPHATRDSFGMLATTDWLRPAAFAA